LKGGETMKKQNLVFPILLLTAFLAGNLVIAPLIFHLPSFGTVTQDYGLTVEPSAINWGNVSLNENVTRQVNITNTGRNIASLNMTYNGTANLLNYTLGWDGEELALPSATNLVANFTLTIYEANVTVSDQFNIDIQIGDQT